MEHFAYCRRFILIINFELSLFSGCAGAMGRARDPLEKWREQNGSHSCEKSVNMRLWRPGLITDVCCTQQLLNHKLLNSLNVQGSLCQQEEITRKKPCLELWKHLKGTLQSLCLSFPTLKGIQQPSHCSKSGSQQITPSPRITPKIQLQQPMGQQAASEDFGSLVVPRITA